MTDLDPRADRVKSIAESVGGRVLARSGNVVSIEVPADMAPGLATLWGMGGFIPIFRRQEFRSGPVSRAFYVYDIGLHPHDPGKPAPGPEAITAPTQPR